MIELIPILLAKLNESGLLEDSQDKRHFGKLSMLCNKTIIQSSESTTYRQQPKESDYNRIEVSSLEELARWIVGRGKKIKILEPVELKNMVIQLADEVIENYQ